MKLKIRDRLSSIKRFCTVYYLRVVNIKFAVKNRRFWQKYLGAGKTDPRSVVVTEVSNNVYVATGIAVAANIVAKVRNARVLYLSRNQDEHIKFKWLRDSFSNSYYETISQIISPHLEEVRAEAKKLYDTLTEPGDILDLKYKGLRIGDLVYDLSMRNGYWQATVWRIDDRVYDTLVKVIGMLFALDYISHQYKVKAALASHTVSFGGLLIRYFANQQVESYCGMAGGPIRKYGSFNGKSLTYRDSISKPWLDNIIQDDEAKNLLLPRARKYIEDRFAGAVRDLDSEKVFAKTNVEYTSKVEFCERYMLPPQNPCVFIMLHAFNDFPHHFEKYIFADYYRWFIETLKIVREVNNVNWIFKEHPSSGFYPNDANLDGMFEIVNEPNILFLDKDSLFRNSSLRYIAHAVITCLGTAGLEFSCFGVPSIIASDNHYSGFNICYEPQTYQAYRKLLENVVDSVKPLDEETQERAMILLYLLRALVYERTAKDKSFFCTTSTSHEERLENSVDKLVAEVGVQLEDTDILEFLGRMENFIADGNRECFYVNEYFDSKLGWKIAPSRQNANMGPSVTIGQKVLSTKELGFVVGDKAEG